MEQTSSLTKEKGTKALEHELKGIEGDGVRGKRENKDVLMQDTHDNILKIENHKKPTLEVRLLHFTVCNN